MKKRIATKINFKPIGDAIKEARNSEGLTQEQIAEKVELDPSYYSRIENSGQHPSLQVLYLLVRMFHISLDEHFFPNEKLACSTRHRQTDVLLDRLTEKELRIIMGTARSILRSREE